MASELSLTWDDHHKSLVGVFERLLDKSTLVDCTIAAEGQYLKAHKIILSASSPYFELLFSQENEKNPIVVLKDIKFQVLKAMIDFIYRGEVKVPEEGLGDFVDAAKSLQIKGLGSGKCQEMSPQNTGNDVVHTQRRMGRTSPLPHKRKRPTDFGDSIERSDASPVNEVNFEGKSFQGPSHDFRVEGLSSCQDESTLSFSNATNGLTSLPSSVHSEMKNLETTECVSFEIGPLTQCEEVLTNPDTVVVKSEFEDVHISDSECYIDPKEEEIAESVELEGAGEETNSELVTNEFPGAALGVSYASAAAGTRRPPADIAAPGVAVGCGSGDGHQIFGSLGGSLDTTGADLDHGKGGASPTVSASTPKKKKPSQCYSCLECGKAFRAPSHLAVHHRTHTGERPFVCDVCGKRFQTKDHRNKHVRVHTGERPYRCGVCGNSFRQSNGLVRHRRLHTGDRPYRCGLCEFTTSHSRYLPVHMRTMHGALHHITTASHSRGQNLE